MARASSSGSRTHTLPLRSQIIFSNIRSWRCPRPNFPTFQVRKWPLTEVNMSNIKTLNDLRGQVSAIWTSSMSVSTAGPLILNSYLKLFLEKHQCQLAYALRSLLSPESGSIISGSHVVLPNKSVFTKKISDKDVKMFCHPVSWKEMWVGQLNAQ
ncbi:hypothetical protein JVT61DRAFT_1261 [Boletus reticuloceps]|uniref:Uncharacterized protein n=1 Tax=Boletus reticuloceps TaxID=495285 RepID=A0A8I3ABE5_9AGAM|nr:hypothetical protein JVT61DRAFT_1261 [Boletus reticuloceps]